MKGYDLYMSGNTIKLIKTPDHKSVLVICNNKILAEIPINLMKHFVNNDERDLLEVIKS